MSFTASSAICVASSRVGASTNVDGAAAPPPREALRAAAADVTHGSRNATVLPEPVCAVAMTSCPASARGIVCFWMGVGVS